MVKITLDINNLVNYLEAARLLGVSRPTIYSLIAEGKLHPLTIGRSRFLLREEIEFIKQLPDRKS